MLNAGSVLIKCPECSTAVSVPVTCRITTVPFHHGQGDVIVTCTPDTRTLDTHLELHRQ
jgi:hypothetical protein